MRERSSDEGQALVYIDDSDEGQALPLVVVSVLVAAVAALALGRLGIRAIGDARAQTAADAAALAGVRGGYPAAAQLATANGARLVSFTISGRDVVVRVESDGSVAEAHAVLIDI
jgi:hypothetical protein